MSEPQVLSMEQVDEIEQILGGVREGAVLTHVPANVMEKLIATVRAKDSALSELAGIYDTQYGALNQRLQAECAVMREALEICEWGATHYYTQSPMCPVCKEVETHDEGCLLFKALSSNSGARWLERNNAMERLFLELKKRDDIHDQMESIIQSNGECKPDQMAELKRLSIAWGEADDNIESIMAGLETMGG